MSELSPSYSEEYPFENLSHEQFLALAIEAARKQRWTVGRLSEENSGFVAYTSVAMSAFRLNVQLMDGYAVLESICPGNQPLDYRINREKIAGLVSEINALRDTLTDEELNERVEEMRKKTVWDNVENPGAQNVPPVAKKNFISFFIPRGEYFITPILVNLNIAIFILMVASGADFFSPKIEMLLAWGANFRPATLDGEWWRLLTNCFIHIGVLHLAMNMYALVYIGSLLEPYLGRWRFLSAYLFTGILASVSSLWWHELTVSAGASGAIFGMYGVFLAMLTTNLIEKTARQSLLVSIAIFVGYNLLNGMKGGIDNAAHIGGLLSGIAIGYSFYPGLKNPLEEKMKYITSGVQLVAVVVIAVFMCSGISNDIGKWQDGLQKFSVLEQQAVGVLQLPESTSSTVMEFELKEHGINNWKKCLAIVNEVDALDIPSNLHGRDDILKHYCAMRIRSYELIYQGKVENTTMYNDSINYYNTLILQDIGRLKKEADEK